MNAKLLGKNQNYANILQQMQCFTRHRTPQTADEIWFLEHADVFTCGIRFNAQDVLQRNLPIFHTNRGGALTFHGQGQLVVYFLCDLEHLNMKPRHFMHALENIVIEFLKMKGLSSYAKKNAPGVYVENNKIASIGLKLEKNYTYHGMALNGHMDLKNFDYILPCGLNQKMTDLNFFNIHYDYQEMSFEISKIIEKVLNVKIKWKH